MTSGDTESQSGSLNLRNGQTFPVSVLMSSKPSWLSFNEAILDSSDILSSFSQGKSSVLKSGSRLGISFTVSPETLEPGTALGTAAFAPKMHQHPCWSWSDVKIRGGGQEGGVVTSSGF